MIWKLVKGGKQARTRLRQAQTWLRQARTLLRQASDKSKIDIVKTILTDFFADLCA